MSSPQISPLLHNLVSFNSSRPASNLCGRMTYAPNFPSHQMEHLTGHLHLIRVISLPNISLVLKIAPSPRTPLLRHERHQLATEAAVFALLAKSYLPIPRLIKHDPGGSHLSSPFLLTTHLPGISYSSVRQYLTRSELSDIERQLHNLSSIITRYSSPYFGSVSVVDDSGRFDTWSEAFTEMIESILMDGEDMLVALPYSEIRHVTERMKRSLDEVKEARLVVRGLGNEENVLIERRANEVTGLLDFGKAFWGDEAWGERKGERGLLYDVYDAVVTIVTNHYRPKRDDSELDSRKKLTLSLAQLAVDDL